MVLAEPARLDQETIVVLVIDDDPLITVVLRRALQGLPHELYSATDGKTGVAEVVARKPDLIVLDNVLPDRLGVEALTEIHELAPNVPVLFITARGAGGTAIEAMKQCAFDYLPKPLEPGRLRTQIDRALSLRRLLRSSEGRALDAPADRTDSPATTGSLELASDVLVGQCPPMQQVFKAIGRVAMQDVTVLVRGEHGTGKEAVARELHRHSRNASGPLVTLHCRGLDDARLAESLFGAVSASGQVVPGRIREAAGGTLVLQEVGCLSMPLQAKLLRAVRDRVYAPVGDGSESPVECRLLAITTEDLETKSRAGDFRSDLYYALSSFVITLPPLRQRHGDLPLLIERLMRRLAPIAEEFGVSAPTISSEAMAALCAHLWPGNIDELESALKRALVEQKGNVLLAADLVQAIGGESVVAPSDPQRSSRHTIDWAAFSELRIEAGSDTLHADAVAETERRVFECVLRHTGGNQARAARILGITRASLRKKLRLYGMAPKPVDD